MPLQRTSKREKRKTSCKKRTVKRQNSSRKKKKSSSKKKRVSVTGGSRSPSFKFLKLERSPKVGKKWCAVFVNKNTGRTKRTHFGDSEAEDYTMHHDRQRRSRYLLRHKKDLRTGDPTRAGFLSYYVLWGPSTSLRTNLNAWKRRFKL